MATVCLLVFLVKCNLCITRCRGSAGGWAYKSAEGGERPAGDGEAGRQSASWCESVWTARSNCDTGTCCWDREGQLWRQTVVLLSCRGGVRLNFTLILAPLQWKAQSRILITNEFTISAFRKWNYVCLPKVSSLVAEPWYILAPAMYL